MPHRHRHAVIAPARCREHDRAGLLRGRVGAGPRPRRARRRGHRLCRGHRRRGVAALGAGRFDLVYTGIGALCWLPSIRDWAATVAALLRPGGRLFIREGHPVLWSLGDTSGPDSPLVLAYPYWEQPAPTRWEEDGSYVQTDHAFSHNVTYEWNHGLGEIVTALLEQGLRITQLVEHDSVPWEALPGVMIVDEVGEWRLREHPERLPASYTLQAIKD